MADQALDRMLIYEAISRYFLALDALDDADAIAGCFTADAVWACYDHDKPNAPVLRFDSRDNLHAVIQLQAAQAGDVMLRHHLTGLVFEALDEDEAQTVAKVLVTAQRSTDPAPQVRNTARCEGRWRRTEAGWCLASWVIRRGPSGEASDG